MAGALCAMTETINRVGTRPRLLIIRHINGDVKGFNELKRDTGLSSRTLSLNLHYLLGLGIVVKSAEAYALSPEGHKLMPILHDIGDWGIASGIVEH